MAQWSRREPVVARREGLFARAGSCRTEQTAEVSVLGGSEPRAQVDGLIDEQAVTTVSEYLDRHRQRRAVPRPNRAQRALGVLLPRRRVNEGPVLYGSE